MHHPIDHLAAVASVRGHGGQVLFLVGVGFGTGFRVHVSGVLRGEDRIRDQANMDVFVPKGVLSGQHIRR